MKKSELEIYNLFEHHNKKLLKRREKIYEKLTNWGRELIRLIEDHVNNQKQILDQHFERQKRFLDSERKRFNVEAAVQEKKKDSEEIDRLFTECKALKLNLPIIYQCESPITSMRIITEEQLALIKAEKNNVQQPKENQSLNRSTENNDYGTGNNASASERSLLRPTFGNAKQTRSMRTESFFEVDYSTSGDGTSKPGVKNGDDTSDQCPVCLMVFARSMKIQDRVIHVNNHYTDD